MKCVIWSPYRLDHSISLPPNLFTLDLGFHILGTPLGFKSFIELFMDEVFCCYPNLGLATKAKACEGVSQE